MVSATAIKKTFENHENSDEKSSRSGRPLEYVAACTLHLLSHYFRNRESREHSIKSGYGTITSDQSSWLGDQAKAARWLQAGVVARGGMF